MFTISSPARVGALTIAVSLVALASNGRAMRPAAQQDQQDAQQQVLGFTQVTAAEGSICGVTTDRRIKCWLANTDPTEARFGERGVTLTDATSVIVVTGIDAKARFLCALTGDGTLQCTKSHLHNPPAGRFSQLSSGPHYACALATDGQTATCWGYAVPSVTQEDKPKMPFPIYRKVFSAGDQRFTQVSAGLGRICFIRANRPVTCMDNDASESFLPGNRLTTLSISSFKNLHPFTPRNCGIKSDGTLDCVNIRPPAGTFTQVSVGQDYACALRADRFIVCWGHNSRGAQTTPIDRLQGQYTYVSAGSDYACAVGGSSGEVVCWGNVPKR